MPIDFVVLGSGTFAPEGRAGDDVRRPAGYALRLREQIVLFDFGFGSLHQLARAGLDPNEISHAFFTHRHPDHVGDLAALLFLYHYADKPKSGTLRLYGPRGFAGFHSRLQRAHYPWLKPRGFRLEVAELEEKQRVEGPGWTVACREVPHSTEALAFRLDSKPASVCYTGDTGFDAGLAKFAEKVDLFVLECSLSDRRKNENHLQVSQALRLFEASAAKKGLLSHLSPESSKEAARKLPRSGRLKIASDLMRVRLG